MDKHNDVSLFLLTYCTLKALIWIRNKTKWQINFKINFFFFFFKYPPSLREFQKFLTFYFYTSDFSHQAEDSKTEIPLIPFFFFFFGTFE